MAWSPSNKFLAFNLCHSKAPLPGRGVVFILDATHPDLPPVAQFHVGGDLEIERLQWASNSAMLFASGRIWTTDEQTKEKISRFAVRVFHFKAAP